MINGTTRVDFDPTEAQGEWNAGEEPAHNSGGGRKPGWYVHRERWIQENLEKAASKTKKKGKKDGYGSLYIFIILCLS